MARLSNKQLRKIHADRSGGVSGLTAFNVKLKRKEVIQSPREVTLKNGRKAIQGVGSDGTKLTRFIKG